MGTSWHGSAGDLRHHAARVILAMQFVLYQDMDVVVTCACDYILSYHNLNSASQILTKNAQLWFNDHEMAAVERVLKLIEAEWRIYAS